MIEVPFPKLEVAVWNNEAVACVCAFIHMGAIENILLLVAAQSDDYVSHCLCIKTMLSLYFLI